MDKKLFFFLEPYVYAKAGEDGVLLVNLLDDRSLAFYDCKSVETASRLLSSARKTVEIQECDTELPIVTFAMENYMGGILHSTSQPLQFASEINCISGSQAYRKSAINSRHDIGRHLAECTIFADASHPDCHAYIEYIAGNTDAPGNNLGNLSGSMDDNDISSCIQEIASLNPDAVINLCGIAPCSLKKVLDRFPNIAVRHVVSSATLRTLPAESGCLSGRKPGYILLTDMGRDSILERMPDDADCVYAKITNEEELCSASEMSDTGIRMRIFPVLSSGNVEFIKSALQITAEDLFGLKNKYRTIKINNLINSERWGKLYVFPDGKASWSLEDGSRFDFHMMHDVFKEAFLTGSFDWTLTRDYPMCRKCMFQYLCPSPSYIENHMRSQNIIECLMCKQQ